jgi:hypothetical protein
MDYSYLNQAAAQFDASSCALTSSMDPTGLGPCSYGDQMSSAAYRYTAAAASMARSYNTAGPMGHHLSSGSAQCAVMARSHQDHRTPMFPASMNLQSRCFVTLLVCLISKIYSEQLLY